MWLADELLNKYQTENPFKLAQYSGFEVVWRPLPKKIRSSFVRTHNTNYLVLNSRTDNITQSAMCLARIGEHFLTSQREDVSHYTHSSVQFLRRDLNVFIISMMIQNGAYTEKSLVPTLTEECGTPKHIAEFLLRTWKEYKQRESGLYVRY
jgi:hypothetical protein